MATSITFTRAGFVAGTVYAVGDVATVSDTDATIAISSRIARYTTDPAPATSEAEVLIDLTSNMTTEQKTAFRSNIGAGTGEGGEGAGDVLSAAPVLAGSVVTTANAMGALVIDVTKSLNTKTITGNVTLSVSATPAASDTRSVLRIYNNSATASVITLPSSPAWYSEGLQADITSFTVPAYWRGELTWCYDGTRFLLNGDRMTAAQAWAAGRPGIIFQAVNITFDPKAVCDGTFDGLALMDVGAHCPLGFVPTSWSIEFIDGDPTTELDLDLMRADSHPTRANSAVMDVLDTTAGASSEATAGNINGGATVANGKVIYLAFGTAYTEANHQVQFQLWGYAP